MSMSRRLLLCVLAALPVVWGNCPYWFAPGSAASAAVGAKSRAPAQASCPCCRHKDDVSARGGPVRPPPDCDDCPMTVARRGSMPVPPSVELPDRQPLPGTAVFEHVSALSAGSVSAPLWVRPPGAPPDPRLLSTVVLTI